MPRILMQGLKAWYDERTDRYNYTPEIQMAPDCLELDAQQLAQIDRDFEAMRGILVGVIARFGALDAQDRQAKLEVMKAESKAKAAARAAEVAQATCPYPAASQAPQAAPANMPPPDCYVPRQDTVPASIKAQLATSEKATWEDVTQTWGATMVTPEGSVKWRPLVQPAAEQLSVICDKQTGQVSSVATVPQVQPTSQVQRTVEGSDLPELPNPAYLATSRTWNYCPDCGNTDVTHVSRAGKEYQACKKCRQWLESDGRKKAMGAR